VAINNRGQIVGIAENAASRVHAFLWENGTMIDLGTLPGDVLSRARGINNRGQIVGESISAGGFRRAFLWKDGTMIDLGALAGGSPSSAWDINAHGDVAGESGDRAVLWTKRRLQPDRDR
jgi:probable HAF family extracellular repeat protein